MNPYFWISFILLLLLIAFFDRKYFMLRDITQVTNHRPYSWSRVQLAWWTLIIVSALTATLLETGQIPVLDSTVLILLGISVGTTATARVIDIADMENFKLQRHQNAAGQNLLVDILTDDKGVSIHRFQAVAFNLVYGIWFINTLINNLKPCPGCDTAKLFPSLDPNNLILLGLSSATYAAIKTTENKSSAAKKEAADSLDAPAKPDGQA